MKPNVLIRFYVKSPLRSERGIALAMVLAVVVLLMGVGSTALFSGYTNMLTSTNLRLATRARATAESGINEALYRLSRQEGQPGAIALDLIDPDWEVQIMPDGSSSAGPPIQVATIQDGSDWGAYANNTPPVTLRYKKDAADNVIFYDRTLNPPFRTDIAMGPGVTIPDTAHPVIQILATALDEREAERQILAEVAYSVAFSPPAALSSGVDVDMQGSGFIGATNHSHLIRFTNVSGNADVYGDNNDETTRFFPAGQRDSPDSSTINLDAPAGYVIQERIFNKQVTDGGLPPTTSAAWEGLTWDSINSRWSGVNSGAVSPMALSTGPVLLDPVPAGGGAVLSSGLFTWGKNSSGGVPLAEQNPPFPTACTGNPPPMVCRPPVLTPFPTFQEFLGLDDISFQNLLDNADVTKADLDAGQRPRGFTYIEGNHTFNNSDPMPLNDQYILMYVSGNLRFNGNARIKGVLFIDGDLDTTGTNYFLGAIMVRGITETDAFGTFTLLYSKKAAELGLQAGKPWRVLSWTDTAMQ